MDKELEINGFQVANQVEIEEMIEQEVENQGEQPLLMQKPFDPTLINIDTKNISIYTLINRINHNEIDLNSETYFQRKANLWTDEKQSRLIESILVNFPLPAFYFDGSDYSKWLVIDGLQRLSSLRRFVVDKELRLKNLEFLTQFNGFSYDELPRDIQRKIEESTILAYIINPGTPFDVKFNIFRRINTGGISLEPQEIRHALFQGAPANFIAELGSLKEFDEATDFAFMQNSRMIDRDFANRFLSFYLLGADNYEPDLDTFLGKGMALIENMSESGKQTIKEDYIASLNLNKAVFGNHAFRKIDALGKRMRINKAVFEVFSVQFAHLSEKEKSIIELRGKAVVEAFKTLLEEDPNFVWALSSSTGDKNRVLYRHGKVKELIHNIIN
jgi:Protein of unknown function DUF262